MQTFCQSHNLNAIIDYLCYEMLFYSEKVMLYYLMVVKVKYNSSSNKKANQFAFFSL